ncbi:MAG: sodium:alanine symporter family protein [Planctomycetes bacterium]|nr:sodium:alanine symporter family protein [Planctomycetota bacterium]
MWEKFLEGITFLDQKILFGPWTLVYFTCGFIFFTVISRFFQIRHIGLIFSQTIGKIFRQPKADGGGMTPFQAASTALAGTVGMGNMAGIATALVAGGPGAIFWMWVLAFFGMVTKTVEISLSVHYRDVDNDGQFRGGPMFYIKKGLGWNKLSKLFSFGILVNSVLCAALLQPYTVGSAFKETYFAESNTYSPYIITVIMAVITGLVIIGGVKRVGRFCGRIVPLMAGVYIVSGLIVFFCKIDQVPQVLKMIVYYAFNPAPQELVGGVAGISALLAIQNGMKRGILSNEAGMGTAPIVHATANTRHPFEQGLWGAFEVFFDTTVVCSITAFAILSTGVLDSGKDQIKLVIEAFAQVYPANIAGNIIFFCILTFCLSTQIGFFIYYKTAVEDLFGTKYFGFFKVFYLLPGIVFAGVTSDTELWAFASIAVFVCAVPNLIAISALSGVFLKLKEDYMSKAFNYSTEKIDVTRDYIRKAKNK